jgi:hypothetical protein
LRRKNGKFSDSEWKEGFHVADLNSFSSHMDLQDMAFDMLHAFFHGCANDRIELAILMQKARALLEELTEF